MENQNLQLDFQKYTAWTGPAGIFGSRNEDHLGAVAFTHYLNKIKRANGGHLPSDQWEIINPEGFLAFLEAEQREGKNYEKLIQKTKEMITKGEMNRYNVLYFAKAFDELGFLEKRDEEISSMYENLAEKGHANNQSTVSSEPVSEIKTPEKLEEKSENVSIPEEKTETQKESAEEQTLETETSYESGGGFEMLSGIVPQASVVQKSEPAPQKAVEKPQEKPVEKAEEPAKIEVPEEVQAQTEIPQNFNFQDVQPEQSATSASETATSQTATSAEEETAKIPLESYAVAKKTSKKVVILPPAQERKFTASFENMLRTRKKQKPKSPAESQAQQPQQAQQRYSQNSEDTTQRSSQAPEVASAGLKIAKRMALATGGSFLGILNLGSPAEAAEFSQSIIGFLF